MSRFIKRDNAVASKYDAIAQSLAPTIASQKAVGYGDKLVSIESFDAATLSAIQGNIDANRATIRGVLAQEGFAGSAAAFGEEASNPTAKHIHARMAENRELAGALALEAASAPREYMTKRQVNAQAVSGQTYDFTTGSDAIALGIQPTVMGTFSPEAFENQTLNAAMPWSVAFNIACAAQDEFSEAFFPTIVVAPDQLGFIAEIRLQSIYNGMQHKKWDEVQGLDKRLLQDAYRDSASLRQEAVRVVPFFDENADPALKLDEVFADPAHVAPREVLIGGVGVRTAPLRFNKELDVLALSAHPALLKNNTYDQTDTLDAKIELSSIFVKMGATNKVVRFETTGLQYVQFQRPQEGHERDMVLNFRGTEFVLDDNTVDVEGNPIPEVKALVDAGFTARLSVRVNGEANTSNAVIALHNPIVKVVQVRSKDTNELVALTDPRVSALLAAIVPEGLYYNLYMNRTNSNFRTQGPIIDTDVFTEKYIIGVRSPIMIEKPIGQDKEFPMVDDLITGVRLRQTHDAMYTLLTYRDRLAQWVNSPANQQPIGEPRRIGNFIGLGKYLVRPYYEKITIDMKKVLNSISSKDKMEDIRAAVTTTLQEAVSRMYRDSDYFVALMIANGGKPAKPHVTIGTDSYLTMMLTIQGDTRLLGDNFNSTVAQSTLREMDNRMFLTFTRPEVKEFDPLSFGNTLYYPELITAVTPFQRNGATINATQVAARYQHINNLPILLEVEVVNMESVTKHLQEIFTVDNTEALKELYTNGTLITP